MYKKFKTFAGSDLMTGRPAETFPQASGDLPSKKLFYFSNVRRIPVKAIFLLIAFAFLGLLNMFSVSRSLNANYFVKMQFFWVVALVPFFIAVTVNLRYLVKLSYVFYGACVLALCAVLVVGSTTMGATRWIDIGFMKIQPSEFAKLGIIFALARYYHFVRDFEIEKIKHTIVALGFCLIPAGLTIIQPDLGSGLIIVFITIFLIFANGIRWFWLVVAGVVVLCSLPVAWNKLHTYQKNRILMFLDPEKDPYGAGYNVIQSKIAIGSGGFFGKGYLDNDQSSLKFLPENQTDFAMTVFAEEFGFVGCIILLGIFAYLVFYGVGIAMFAKSNFCRTLATGVSALLFLHIAINMLMVMGLLPVVGIPLPFISYGGSSLMISVTCIGVLVNIDINKHLVIQGSQKTYMLK